MPADIHQRSDLPFPTSLPQFQRLFPNDAACAKYLEDIRWDQGFTCEHCGDRGEPFRFKAPEYIFTHCLTKRVCRGLIHSLKRFTNTERRMFTVDKEINQHLSDQFIKYRTLRFNGLVRGQLVDRNGSAEAICCALNETIVTNSTRAKDFL